MNRVERINSDLQSRQSHYEPEIRLRILAMIEDGFAAKHVAARFGITTRTIYNWQKQYDEFGLEGLEDRPRPGGPPLLSTDQVQKCITDITDRGDLVTKRRVWQQIKDRHGVKYSIHSIKRILDRMNQTYKKANPVHARAAINAEADQWCREYLPKIDRSIKKGFTLVSVDEARSEIDSDSRYGYSRRGERIYCTYQGRKQSISLIGGVAPNGRSVFRTQERSNSALFIEFLDDIQKQIGPSVVLTDGASYHKSQIVKRWLDENPSIILVYLPVGSPHMNVIEIAWSIYKKHMRQNTHHTMEEFRRESSKFLRTHRFNLDVREKLESRLPPNAEARVLEARARLPAKRCK